MPTDLMPGKATAAAEADRRGADTTVDRDAAGAPFHQGRRFLADLDDRSEAFGYIGPNLFASVMGTGIVANAAATLPFHVPGLIDAARAVWVLDVVLLAVIGTATVAHWALFPDVARGHLRHPVMAHFYGAPAMALMTVGAGALLVGRPVVGDTAAVAIAATLWIAGTLFGLATAVVVPLKAFSDRPAADAAFGGWLMPVVPPMVSAATGPLLITHLPAGQWRLALLLCCAAMFGLTLIASLVVITLICARLMHTAQGPRRACRRCGSCSVPSASRSPRRTPSAWPHPECCSASIPGSPLMSACSTAYRYGDLPCCGSCWRPLSRCVPPAPGCRSISPGGRSPSPSAPSSPARRAWRPAPVRRSWSRRRDSSTPVW